MGGGGLWKRRQKSWSTYGTGIRTNQWECPGNLKNIMRYFFYQLNGPLYLKKNAELIHLRFIILNSLAAAQPFFDWRHREKPQIASPRKQREKNVTICVPHWTIEETCVGFQLERTYAYRAGWSEQSIPLQFDNVTTQEKVKLLSYPKIGKIAILFLHRNIFVLFLEWYYSFLSFPFLDLQ